jgi:hypothetical protein
MHNRREFIRGLGVAATGGLFSTKLPAQAAALPIECEVGTLPQPVARVPITPFGASPGDWTLAVMPDSQHDAAFFPEVLIRQTQWLAAHRASHQIAMLVHVGDVTDDNSPRQWGRVKEAFDILANAGVPFSLTTGNHDLEMRDHVPVSRSTRLNEYFAASAYQDSREWGLHDPARIENSWHELESPHGRVLILSLEMGPPDAVLDWARQVIAMRSPQLTILVTHAYLYHDGTRYDFGSKGSSQSAAPKGYPIPGLNDGEDVWEKLVKLEPTIRLVLCGHATGDGQGYLVSRNDAGAACHQLLANYQLQVRPSRGFGSGGFLRLLQFSASGSSVQVRTYSPWYNLWLTGPEQDFALALNA